MDFSVDYANKKLTMNPIDENIKLPLCLPDILATVSFTDNKSDIEYLKGNLKDWEITIK